jgi:uncharacterized protein YaeQ
VGDTERAKCDHRDSDRRAGLYGPCEIAKIAKAISPDEPTIAIRDLTGALTAWIDVGTPDAERRHKASKLAGRVAVYTHKEPAQFLKQLAGRKIYNAAALELYAIDRGLINSLVARLERRVGFSVSVIDRVLYVTIGADTLTGGVVRLP